MPPYCYEHGMFHDNPAQCYEMRTRARREAKAAALREKAERIAREILALNLASAEDANASDAALMQISYTGARVREMLTAAALEALTERENA